MKKLIFSSIIGLALIAFTGCTNGNDADTVAKCQSGKCQSSKCQNDKAKSSKCSGDKKSTAKCSSSGKCGK